MDFDKDKIFQKLFSQKDFEKKKKKKKKKKLGTIDIVTVDHESLT